MVRFVLMLLAGALSASIAHGDNKPKAPSDSKAAAVARAEQKKPPKVVMATVGGSEITVEQFMQYLAKTPARVEDAMTTSGKASLLRDLIANALMTQALRKEAHLPEKPTEQETLKAYSAFGAKHFPKPPVPDDKTLQAYYDAHQGDFGIPATVRLSELQFRPGPHGVGTPEERVAAKKRAEAALERVNKGEDFGALADELTENPLGKGKKGDSGFIPKEKYAWLKAAVKDLKVGGHTGVIESPGAYHILKLTDERPSLVTPFPEVRDKVIKAYQEDEQKKARLVYLRQLSKEIPVEIKLDDLKGEFAQGVFP